MKHTITIFFTLACLATIPSFLKPTVSPEVSGRNPIGSVANSTLPVNSALATVEQPPKSSPKSDPLPRFLEIATKLFRSPEEDRDLRRLLSNPVMIRLATKALQAETEYLFDVASQERRLNWIEYVYEGLRWKDNPQAQALEQLASEMINRDITSRMVPISVRKSLAGDQIELFRILRITRPRMALEIYEKSRGKPYEAIIAYAINLET